MSEGELTEVAAAVIERDGRLLLARRRRGSHLEGLWEFPGGKRGPDESLPEALRREIREELDAAVDVGEVVEVVDWEYPGKRLRLHFFRCTLRGEPRSVEGQELAWVLPADLPGYDFPPADARLIERLARG